MPLPCSVVKVSKRKVVIGIDPGESGAICVLDPGSKEVIFIPTTWKPIETVEWYKALLHECTISVVMVEKVHAIPGAAAGTSFKFGANVNLVETVPLTLGISLDKVTPKTWQKFIGLTAHANVAAGPARKKAIKHGVADICDRLYPNVNIRGPRGGLLDGRSDALMIAHYASQTFKT